MKITGYRQFLSLPLKSITPKENIFIIIYWVFTIHCQVKITDVQKMCKVTYVKTMSLYLRTELLSKTLLM